MSQLTHPGPAVKESLRVRSVAPPASRPGPTRHRGHRHDSVAEPLPFSWVPWQQEVPVLNKQIRTVLVFTFMIFMSLTVTTI